MRQLLRLIAVLAFATTSVLVGLPANADANLITNGDFATGDTTGWTLTGDTSFTVVVTGGTPPQASYLLAGPTSPAELSQSFSTIAGQAYQISFDLQAESTTADPAFFAARFNGGTIFSTPTPATSFSWTTFTFTETASTTSSILSFDYVQNNDVDSFYDLTNVSVTAVPEPGVYAMMGIGLLLMAFVVRHRRKE